MLTYRSEEKELIDLGPTYYTHDEYALCLKKLFQINKMLGFFKSTLKILKSFPRSSSLLDVGCGNGLFLLNLAKHYHKFEYKGIDINPEAIDLAKIEFEKFKIKQTFPAKICFQVENLADLPSESEDIVITTLVCHHLLDHDLILFLQQLYRVTRQVVIINDLHRHVLAYFTYKLLSPILFNNRLITHDGLISIKRSFIRQDFQRLLKLAGIQNYKIT